MLAGIWNSKVCPGLAVSGRGSATWLGLEIALEEEILDRVRLGPGFSVTFSPNGETQTSFCPGVCVSGMTHSIVSSFSPGTAGAGSSAGADAGTGVTTLSGNVSVWPGWAVSGTFSAIFMPVCHSRLQTCNGAITRWWQERPMTVFVRFFFSSP